MSSEINLKIKEWLAKQFKTNQSRIEQLLDDELATTYLLIWPIMEQEIFEGFMKKDKIKSAAKKYRSCYNKLDIDKEVRYFHKRYQNKEYYRHLKYYDNFRDVDEILNKQYEILDYEERLLLMFYVVYRYRNNIFHGSKGIASWTCFSDQINKCLKFMMAIVDCCEK